MFDETASLRIRGYRESDLDKLVALFADPSVRRGDPAPVIPKNEVVLKRELPIDIEGRLMFCILEKKEPLPDEDSWVGFVSLSPNGSPKNRDVHLGIALAARHRDKGYGRHQ
jgi:RimJ/RimL family protein N-acetyltransferase